MKGEPGKEFVIVDYDAREFQNNKKAPRCVDLKLSGRFPLEAEANESASPHESAAKAVSGRGLARGVRRELLKLFFSMRRHGAKPASKLANLFRIEVRDHALGLVTQQLRGRVTEHPPGGWLGPTTLSLRERPGSAFRI